MKSLVLAVICSLVFLSVSNVSAQEAASNGIDFSFNGNTQDLNLFFNGMFHKMNSSTPADLMECFNDETAEAVFHLLDFFGDAYRTYMIMDTSNFPSIIQEGNSLKSQLAGVEPCIEEKVPSLMTFTGILTPAKFNELKLEDALYMEVDQSDFYSDYMNFLSFLQDGQYYDAGDVFAKMFTLDALSSTDGLPNDEWGAFMTGKFAAVNITEPQDVFSCFDTDEAEESLKFFSSWASNVSRLSSAEGISASTWIYLQDQRAGWYHSGNSTIETCVDGTASGIKYSKALGFAAGSNHTEVIQAYFSNSQHSETYYNTFVSMHKDFQNKEFFQAGYAFGKLLYQISETN